MKIRAFFGGTTTDVSLDGRNKFTIGGGVQDSICIPNETLMPGYAEITKSAAGWELACASPFTFIRNNTQRESVRELVKTFDICVLKKNPGISLVIMDDWAQPCVVDISGRAQVSIGHDDKINDIVISSLLVSAQHAVTERRREGLFIVDKDSTNGTFVDSLKITEQLLCSGSRITLGDATLIARGDFLELYYEQTAVHTQLPVRDSNAAPDGNITFQRSPRLKSEPPTDTIEIEQPPSLSGKPEKNWLTVLLPTLATIGIAVVMALVMKNYMMLLYTLPMTVSGIVVSIVNYRNQNKKHIQHSEARESKYLEYIKNSAARIEQKQAEQLSALRLADPDIEACFDVAHQAHRRLWERRPSDKDFVSARIGSGEIDSSVKITIPRKSLKIEDDALESKPGEVYEKYRSVKNAPITCSLLNNSLLGIVGSHADCVSLIKNMTVQLTTTHCYTDVKTVFIYDRPDETELDWVKQLPHTKSDDGDQTFVSASAADSQLLLKDFFEILKNRKRLQSPDPQRSDPSASLPHILFVFVQPAFLDRSDPIYEYLLKGNDLGISSILAVESIMQLPKECGLIIEVNEKHGEIYDRDNAAVKQIFSLDEAEPASFRRFGRDMSRIRSEEPEKAETIPPRFSFYQMVKVEDASQLDIGHAWDHSKVEKSIVAPLGIGENGKLINLDLHEKGDGPHGLVAGTTGSGKSELLQSYILSMAIRYRPSEVGFVIIDFKGGGMANQFAKLPHLLAAITDIEGAGIERSLRSIKAEVQKRERLFGENKVNNIDDYIAGFKNGMMTTPLPHLIIIVDEFAELRAEQPEFMKELISASRKGRSLGIHLILATQKPSGQVDEQIWSNSRFQICLKVISPEDSSEVIKSSLAADITLPGRAYLRVDNDGRFELFQSGYSGIKAPGTEMTQFQEVVQHIAQYFDETGAEQPASICLPALGEIIAYPEGVKEESLALGIFDDPDNQRQGKFYYEIDSKNAFIVGSSLSGKTNLLQCIIRGIADSFTPDEANIYIIDFASGTLRGFEQLRHVGGIVTALESEKLKNLFKLLNCEMTGRLKRFSELGVGSFAAYCEAGRNDIPRIVLIIDNISALKEMYLQDEDPLFNICKDGLRCGISVIAANSQISGMGYTYLAHFATKIALFCNDSSEYSAVFDRCTLRLPDKPGRCLVEIEKRVYLCQAYLAYPGEKEIDRANNIRGHIAKIEKMGYNRAKQIPMIPEFLSAEDLLSANIELMDTRGKTVIGLDYEDVSPVVIDFGKIGFLAMSGSDPASGRGILRYVIYACGSVYAEQVVFYIADSIGRGLSDCPKSPAVSAYEFLPEKNVALVKSVHAQLAERYRKLMEGDDSVLDRSPLLILVINGQDAIQGISEDAGAMAAINGILGKYKNMGVCVILGECENIKTGYDSPEPLKKLRDEQKLLFWGELGDVKIFEVDYHISREFRQPAGENDGFYITGRGCRRIRLVTSENVVRNKDAKEGLR